MASLSLWSAEEDRVLRDVFPWGGTRGCSTILERTPQAIKRRCADLKIRRADGWRKLPLTEQKGSCSPRRPAIERWREGYDLVGECWVWRGAKSVKGYAYFRDDRGQRISVHRFAYRQFVGPIPAGLVIDHLCKNPGCCNPAHLEAVTNRENVLRGARGQVKVTVTHCKRGHEFTAENVWIAASGSRNCKTCARERGRRYDRERVARARR